MALYKLYYLLTYLSSHNPSVEDATELALDRPLRSLLAVSGFTEGLTLQLQVRTDNSQAAWDRYFILYYFVNIDN